jgi:dTDP-4-amino-4,6-dideoxygalactose transaminase
LIDVWNSLFCSTQCREKVYNYFSNRKLFFLSSARAGLSLLIRSIANGSNLRIGVQVYNCRTVFQAIIKAGCTPVFLDIEKNFSISLDDLKKKKNQIDLLIVTHIFGIPVDFEALKKVIDGKIIIEDCAHAFMSEYSDKPCGTFGDAAVFSFGYGKFPSIGHGGCVVLNNGNVFNDFVSNYDKLCKPHFLDESKEVLKNLIYSFAFKPFIYGSITYPFFKKLDKKYDFIGKNSFIEQKGFRVNENVFFSNFDRFGCINKTRKGKAILLISLLNEKQQFYHTKGNNFYIFPVISEKRDIIIEELFKLGFECGKHFSRSIEVAEDFLYLKGALPNSERIAESIVSIPLHPTMAKVDLERIAVVINRNSSGE